VGTRGLRIVGKYEREYMVFIMILDAVEEETNRRNVHLKLKQRKNNWRGIFVISTDFICDFI
jgi:hypothetical protein